MSLYSASVEDLATVGFLLGDQEIILLPRYTAKLPVDLRTSQLPAQSAF
jgi:hypothetical protein